MISERIKGIGIEARILSADGILFLPTNLFSYISYISFVKKLRIKGIMEAITHILTGIVIQVLCFIYFIFPFNLIFTIVFAFFSHYLIDALAKITYHTPEAHPEDKVWVVWHLITPTLIVVLLVWLLLINWILVLIFLIGAISANFVDVVDWLILRAILKKDRESNYFLHDSIDIIRNRIAPFTWLPNWNQKYRGIIPEALIILILWLTIFFMLPFFPLPSL